MKSQYNKTITACFVGYIVQAIANFSSDFTFLSSMLTELSVKAIAAVLNPILCNNSIPVPSFSSIKVHGI